MNRVTMFVLSSGAMFGVSSVALGTVTAEFFPNAYTVGASIGFAPNAGMNTKFGQSFLALTSGALENIVIGNLYHDSGGNMAQQPLRVDIFDVTDTGGLPTGAALGGWNTPASSIPVDTFPLSPTLSASGPTIPIIAGRQYAFVLGTETGVNVNFNPPYSIGGSFEQYASGSAIRVDVGPFNEDFDIGFQVNVVVPGPGTGAMITMLGLAGMRRRR